MKLTPINRFLYARGLSQKEIADALKLHPSTVSLLLGGTIQNMPHRLDQIAKMARVSRKKLKLMIEENRTRAA